MCVPSAGFGGGGYGSNRPDPWRQYRPQNTMFGRPGMPKQAGPVFNGLNKPMRLDEGPQQLGGPGYSVNEPTPMMPSATPMPKPGLMNASQSFNPYTAGVLRRDPRISDPTRPNTFGQSFTDPTAAQPKELQVPWDPNPPPVDWQNLIQQTGFPFLQSWLTGQMQPDAQRQYDYWNRMNPPPGR